MELDKSQTLNEPGYQQLGPNAEREVNPFDLILHEATRVVRSEDFAGRLLDLREAEFMRMDLARDDVGWTRLTGASNLDLSDSLRNAVVWRARQYARFDGIVRQTVALYTNFAIGKGFTWSVKEDAKRATQVLDTFTQSRWNRQLFSTQGQRNQSNALYTDGEIFFTLFIERDMVKVRTIDPMEIIDIATNPEDKSEPRIYMRRFFVGSQEHTRLYADWMWDGKGEAKDSQGQLVSGDLQPALVFHMKLAGRGLRGESGLIADMDWAKQYRAFMTCRAAVTRAIAMFVHKLKMQGNAAALAAVKTQLGTGLSESSSETNPPPVAGSTFLENMNATLSSMNQETGAAAAKVDAGLFMNMAAMGSGIFPHYYGLDNSFRLATATSMEPPMFKALSAYQELWRDTYQLLFEWVLERAGVSEEERAVTVTGEPIREQNIQPMVDGIEKMVRSFPMLADSDDLAKHALSLLGINDPTTVMAQLQTEVAKIPGRNVMALVYRALREAVEQGNRQQEG